MVDDRLVRPARAAATVMFVLALTGCAEASNDASGNADDAGARVDAATAHDASHGAYDGAYDGATPPATDAGTDGSAAADTGPDPMSDSAPPPEDDSASPFPACATNADCPGFVADAGTDGDVRVMCLILGCQGGGQCVPTIGCNPSPDPWCGCDGVMYANACAALRAGVSLATTCDDAGSP